MNINILTSNIRFDNPEDTQNPWNERKNLLADIYHYYRADLVGTQEGKRPQINQLRDCLPSLTLLDHHRQWIEERMYPCLFLNTNKFQVIRSGDFWLSETPSIPGSLSFGSAFPRLCTWAHLNDSFNHRQFFVFNVHLDHLKSETRVQQFKVLRSEIKKINSLDFPTILMGDFNDGPQSSLHSMALENFRDPYFQFNQKEQGSYHSFKGDLHNGERIDWIMIGPHFTAIDFEISKFQRAGKWPSDHYPVFCSVKLS